MGSSDSRSGSTLACGPSSLSRPGLSQSLSTPQGGQYSLWAAEASGLLKQGELSVRRSPGTVGTRRTGFVIIGWHSGFLLTHHRWESSFSSYMERASHRAIPRFFRPRQHEPFRERCLPCGGSLQGRYREGSRQISEALLICIGG